MSLLRRISRSRARTATRRCAAEPMNAARSGLVGRGSAALASGFTRRQRWNAIAVLTSLAFGTLGGAVPARAQEDEYEVRTRGPVHEAFAELVSFDPRPGPVIALEPPPGVEELAPSEGPEQDDAVWIPGYWTWDDERSDFTWISGAWRVPPPGHEFLPGYWRRVPGGWQRIPGYWKLSTADVVYEPEPPRSLESGPSSPAPSGDRAWSPGYWEWVSVRHVWRPGWWILLFEDMVWIPARHLWTPCGWVFVPGHWDHSVPRRGILYAPVILRPLPFGHRHPFLPRIMIDAGPLVLHLFARPSHHHYYFGDWYAPACWYRGILPVFSFHSSLYGWDPIHVHGAWHHRHDRGWEDGIRRHYLRLRDDERERPYWTPAEHRIPSRDGAADPRALVRSGAGGGPRGVSGPAWKPLSEEARSRGLAEARARESIGERRRSVETVLAAVPAVPGREVRIPRRDLPDSPEWKPARAGSDSPASAIEPRPVPAAETSGASDRPSGTAAGPALPRKLPRDILEEGTRTGSPGAAAKPRRIEGVPPERWPREEPGKEAGSGIPGRSTGPGSGPPAPPRVTVPPSPHPARTTVPPTKPGGIAVPPRPRSGIRQPPSPAPAPARAAAPTTAPLPKTGSTKGSGPPASSGTGEKDAVP